MAREGVWLELELELELEAEVGVEVTGLLVQVENAMAQLRVTSAGRWVMAAMWICGCCCPDVALRMTGVVLERH